MTIPPSASYSTSLVVTIRPNLRPARRTRNHLVARTGRGERGTTVMPDPQDQITKFWSMVAPGYEDRGSNVAEHGTDEYLLWLAAVGAVLPDEPADVVDLATGTGFLALFAAELGHRVTGTDLSTAMLSLAERTARRRGLDVR